jgi:hypothetical protein
VTTTRRRVGRPCAQRTRPVVPRGKREEEAMVRVLVTKLPLKTTIVIHVASEGAMAEVRKAGIHAR